jgi:hypothetical protein
MFFTVKMARKTKRGRLIRSALSKYYKAFLAVATVASQRLFSVPTQPRRGNMHDRAKGGVAPQLQGFIPS